MRRISWLVLAAGLLAACARYTQLSMTPTQEIAQAEDALRRGQYETAVHGFSDYLATGHRIFRARAFFELAQAQYGLQNYAAALDTLADLEDQYPDQEWPQIPALRGDIKYELGQRSEAIREWDLAWDYGTHADRQFLYNRIAKTIDELTPEEAAGLAGELHRDEVRAMLAERFPAIVGSIEPAPPPLPVKIATPGPYYPPPESESPTEEEAAALGAMPSEALGIGAGEALAAGVRVGCVLPLSGPNRYVGERALAGLRRAFAGSPDLLIVRDSGGAPDRAAQLVVAMADDPTVVGLVTPASGSAAEALAPLADRLQIPLLLLVPSPGVEGPYVLAIGSTPDAAPPADGAAPAQLEARAYNAGKLLRRAVAQGARTRGAVLQFLRAHGAR